jgi:hypothetical protein
MDRFFRLDGQLQMDTPTFGFAAEALNESLGQTRGAVFLAPSRARGD